MKVLGTNYGITRLTDGGRKFHATVEKCLPARCMASFVNWGSDWKVSSNNPYFATPVGGMIKGVLAVGIDQDANLA